MIKMDDMEKQRLELNPSRTSKIPEAKQRGVGVHLPPAGDLMEDFDNFCHAECIERSLPSMLRSFAALRMTKDAGFNPIRFAQGQVMRKPAHENLSTAHKNWSRNCNCQ